MSRVHLAFFPLTLLISLIALGCAANPIVPSPAGLPEAQIAHAEPDAGNHHCFGLYGLAIATATSDIEVLPMRSLNWHFNMVGVLNGTMGVKAVGVPGEADPANGLFVFDITLKHPFATKLQFSGFDVKGILITPGTLMIGSLLFADVDETRLENADGYTRWWNPTEFPTAGWFGYTKGVLTKPGNPALTAKINPYKYFADALTAQDDLVPLTDVSLDDDIGRGVFRAGSNNTRRYYIRFPMNPGPIVVYGYAVDVAWAKPSPNPPSAVPDDFPINANQAEAFRVDLTASVNTLYYDSESGVGGGVLRLQSGIHDWQGLQAGNVEDQVALVRAYCPDLLMAPVDLDFQSECGGEAVYWADLWKAAIPTKPGKSLLALKVDSAGGPTYDQGVAPAPSNSLCAWQTIEVNVVDPPCEPDSNNSYTEAETIGPKDSVTGILCPTEDPSDWYRLDIPVGKKASGSITYYHGPSNEGGAALQWQDSNGVKIKQSDSSDAYNWLTLSESELLPGTYYIQVTAMVDPGAFTYLLETNIEVTDASPTNPVDVSMDDMDCDVTWVDARYIGSNHVYGAGPAGTWMFDAGYSKAYVISRTTDPLYTIPAFCNGRMYYVEDYSDDPAGIDFVDYSSPAVPVHTEDVISMPFNVECMTMNSQYLFVAVDHGSNTYVHIFDYSSDPTSPSFVNSFEVPHNQIKMALIDPEGPNTALVTMTTNDLSVYDVENPLSISFKDNTTLLGYCTQEDLAIDGWFIAKTYLNNISGTGALQVYKYSASSGLEFWGAKTLSGDGTYVTAGNYYAYVENGSQTIACIYYGAQNSLEFKTSVNAFADVGALSYRSGELVAVTVGGGFRVWDYSDSDNPSLIDKTNCVNNPKDGVIDGDYLYFVDAAPGYGALKTVKRTGPSTFIMWDDDRLAFRPSCVAHYGDVMAIGSFDDQYLALVNQTDPEDPAVPLVLYCDNPVTSVAVTQTTVYAATQGGKLRMIDVSDWPNYDIQIDYSFPGQLWSLRVYHNYLLGSYYNKVRIFGISDPVNPFYYGDYSYGGSSDIRDMELQGDYLYLDTGGTIEILNIKNMLSPIHTGGVNLPYALTQFNLAVEGSYGYAADWGHSPVVVTLFPPNAPSIFGEPFGSPPHFTTRGLIVDNGTLYVLHDHIGLQIFNLY